jgi:hypothetical protein
MADSDNVVTQLVRVWLLPAVTQATWIEKRRGKRFREPKKSCRDPICRYLSYLPEKGVRRGAA